MRARAGLGSLLAWALALVACQHDLDRLQRGLEPGSVPLRDGGRPSAMAGGGEDAGRAGSGGRAGAAAGAGGTVSPTAACEPCERLSAAATQLGLRSCCRGLTSQECGLTFGDGAVCLNRMVPGRPDPDCAAANAGGMRLDGCCRPDGRCGLAGAQHGLGCVARDNLPRAAGGIDAPIFCNYECAVDDDCAGTATTNRCSENDARTERLCAAECRRDQDCPRGLVCALTNDVAMDRVLSICREPPGSVEFGEFCSSAADCANGVCLIITGREPYCSRLCRNDGDCPGVCFEADIPSPVSGQLQTFSICEK